jgi:hypothetical protein
MTIDLLGDQIPDTPAMTAPLPWHVYQMNDHPEWWIARTLDEAREAASAAWGDHDPELTEDAFELCDESMIEMTLDCSEDPGFYSPIVRTFREELDRRIAAGLSAPEFFAGVE